MDNGRVAVGLGVFILLINLFLFINADWLFGTSAEAAKATLQTYLLLLAVTLAAAAAPLPLLNTNPMALVAFVVAFIVTVLLVMPVFGAFLASFDSVKTALSFGLLYAFSKAFIEEVVFRVVLPIHLKLGDIVSSLLFGVFHFSILTVGYSALGMVQPFSMVMVQVGVLVMLGYIWAKLRDRVGLMASVGSHFGWNTAVLGLSKAVLGV